MHLILFNNMLLPYSHPLANLSRPSVRIQVLERIEMYFKNYKWQIKLG